MVTISIATQQPGTEEVSFQAALDAVFGSISGSFGAASMLGFNTLVIPFTGVGPIAGGSVLIGPTTLGSLDFPGGTWDPGETPISPLGSVEALVGPQFEEFALISISGFAASWEAFLGASAAPAPFFAGNDVLDGGRANDAIRGYAGNDRIGTGDRGNDTAFGGFGNDRVISFGPGTDVLHGGSGSDFLHGGTGPDALFGGLGRDRLTGSRGPDTLTGGADRDVFDFRPSEFEGGRASGVGLGRRDTVTDFARGTDRLNLDLDGPGAQFALIGQAAFTASGQVRWIRSGDDVRVLVNINDTLLADMEILVQDAARLGPADFIL